MSKKKSKSQKARRSKEYRGKDAAVKRERVTRISVPKRSKLKQWYLDNRVNVLTRIAQIAFLSIFLLISYLIISWIF